MCKRKVKPPKDIETHKLIIGSFSSGKMNLPIPIFEDQSYKGNKIGTLFESIKYMCDLGAMQAIEMKETGIYLSMLSLSKNETLTLDDIDFKEIKVTRIG